MEKTVQKFHLTAAHLRWIALGAMLLAHLWAMVIPGSQWLTCAGRIAFPIFAFLLAEGCRRTSDRLRYFLRLLVWAVLSEIPFNLMYVGSIFYPFHQNVLWTFLISLALISLIDQCRAKLPAVPAWVLG